ncbi:MAG: P1 family peptidase [Eggerthellaceae bacterium]|jgi:L-aminopeptidase/D-esterase-like protein|nr:P1 family peptidase [Eggerthellaceae bacterium]MCH4220343.1 P1 family peptidase [Eggerthellaceae bacterium]
MATEHTDEKHFSEASLSDVPAFYLGNETDISDGTGTTVIIAPKGVIAGCDVRGGGPATRETDLLRSENMVHQVHAIMLSGGSAFGLAAADGVMRALDKAGIGLSFAGMHVPIVPSACLFDLALGRSDIRPDAEFGRHAVEHALARDPFERGCVGAGTGASVGKILGFEHAMKSGLGLNVVRYGSLVVGAVVAVNASGSIVDRQGRVIAGARDAHGKLISRADALPYELDAIHAYGNALTDADKRASENTSIGCVFTNACLTKAQANKVASMTHDAYGRAIYPVHTPNDGDTIFCMASGEVTVPAPVDMVGLLSCVAMREAIYDSVYQATDGYGLPSIQGL